MRRLAEEGIEGARALLGASASADERLARRIADLRERLKRQASRRVGRVQDEYEQRVVQLESVGRTEQERIAAEIAALDARRRAARELDLSRITDPDLLSEVQSALFVPDASWAKPPKRAGILERLRRMFARLAAWFRRLFGRGAPPAKATRDRSLSFATLTAGGRVLGPSDVGEILTRLSAPQREELTDRVDQSLKSRERELQKTAEEKRKEVESQRRSLEAERAEAERRARREAEDWAKQAEERRLTRELKERGLVAERDGQLAVTYGLIQRFARLVLEEETRAVSGDVRLSFKGSASTGVYEKARLRQPEEVAHLDLPSSLVAARMAGLRHIDETVSVVFREVTSERVHVVMMFDKSGSMAEGGKLLAAKKALLALYMAIRRRHPDATIDVVAFENEVKLLDLLELWECTPGSFTNTAEALHTAHLLLRASRATRREVYVVTDGLPEAYTDLGGRVRSGNLDAALEHALARASELATITPLKFSMILLKSEHPEYEVAARRITRTLRGELVITDPQHLGVELLVRWARGTETVKRSVGPPPSPLPPSAAARGAGRKKKRADRRMGG